MTWSTCSCSSSPEMSLASWSMSFRKPFTAASALGPSPPVATQCAAAVHNEVPAASAWSRTTSSDLAPTPRVGRFTTRSNEASSARFDTRRR